MKIMFDNGQTIRYRIDPGLSKSGKSAPTGFYPLTFLSAAKHGALAPWLLIPIGDERTYNFTVYLKIHLIRATKSSKTNIPLENIFQSATPLQYLSPGRSPSTSTNLTHPLADLSAAATTASSSTGFKLHVE